MKPLVSAFLLAASAAAIPAQAEQAPKPWTYAAGPLVSFQPASYRSTSPYLDRGLGGIAPGAFFSAARRVSNRISLGIDLSSTLAFRTRQSGRFVNTAG